MNELELSLRDSVALENCKTERELRYALLCIEARHTQEGISPMALEAYEAEKRRHIARIYRTVAA
jgi:hypothetical protein